MKRMGYGRTEEGKWEEISRYIERQSGIFAVWAAMTTHSLTAKATTSNGENCPYPLHNAWRWAARALNQTATNEIECAIMATFLEVVNQHLLRKYKRQGVKIIALAVDQAWIGDIKGPAVSRLEIMRDEFRKSRRIGEEDFGEFVP
jgi:nucleoporin GLE1